MSGCLYICNYGCALRFFLVVTGEAKGQIWFDRTANGKGISPMENKFSERLTFVDWYESWLDESLAKIKKS